MHMNQKKNCIILFEHYVWILTIVHQQRRCSTLMQLPFFFFLTFLEDCKQENYRLLTLSIMTYFHIYLFWSHLFLLLQNLKWQKLSNCKYEHRLTIWQWFSLSPRMSSSKKILHVENLTFANRCFLPFQGLPW